MTRFVVLISLLLANIGMSAHAGYVLPWRQSMHERLKALEGGGRPQQQQSPAPQPSQPPIIINLPANPQPMPLVPNPQVLPQVPNPQPMPLVPNPQVLPQVPNPQPLPQVPNPQPVQPRVNPQPLIPAPLPQGMPGPQGTLPSGSGPVYQRYSNALATPIL